MESNALTAISVTRISRTLNSLLQQSSTSALIAILSSRVDALEPTDSTISVIDGLMSSILNEKVPQTSNHFVSSGLTSGLRATSASTSTSSSVSEMISSSSQSMQAVSSRPRQPAMMTLRSIENSRLGPASSIVDIYTVDLTIQPTETEFMQSSTKQASPSFVSNQLPVTSSVSVSKATTIFSSAITSLQSTSLLIHSSLLPTHPPTAALSHVSDATSSDVTGVFIQTRSLASQTIHVVQSVSNTVVTSGSMPPQPSIVTTHSSSDTVDTAGSRKTGTLQTSKLVVPSRVTHANLTVSGAIPTSQLTARFTIRATPLRSANYSTISPSSSATNGSITVDNSNVSSFGLDRTEATVFMSNSLVTVAMVTVGSITAMDVIKTTVHTGSVVVSSVIVSFPSVSATGNVGELCWW